MPDNIDMIHYNVRVRFDDRTASACDAEAYSKALKKYDAVGVGHEKTGTSTIFVRSDRPINLKKLAEDLGAIKIIQVRKKAY